MYTKGSKLAWIRFMESFLSTFIHVKLKLSEPVFGTTVSVDFLRNGIPSFKSKIIKIIVVLCFYINFHKLCFEICPSL